MIFSMVGTQLPFPRLMSYLESLSQSTDETIIAQTAQHGYEPTTFEAYPFMAPDAFDRYAGEARILIAHAGIGSILTARRLGKPLILVPRRFDLGEHRNDHQMATAKQLENAPGLSVAYDLPQLEERVLHPPQILQQNAETPERRQLINFVEQFIHA